MYKLLSLWALGTKKSSCRSRQKLIHFPWLLVESFTSQTPCAVSCTFICISQLDCLINPALPSCVLNNISSLPQPGTSWQQLLHSGHLRGCFAAYWRVWDCSQDEGSLCYSQGLAVQSIPSTGPPRWLTWLGFCCLCWEAEQKEGLQRYRDTEVSVPSMVPNLPLPTGFSRASIFVIIVYRPNE